MVAPISAGLLRLKSIIKPHGPLPLSKSTFYSWIAAGRIDAPLKLGPRISAWPADYISKLVEEGIPAVDQATKSGGKS